MIPKPWKRAERIAEQCRSGKTLCRYNRQTETGSTEIAYFLEPGGAPGRSEVGAERDAAWPTDPFGRRTVRCGIQPDMDRAMTPATPRADAAGGPAPSAPHRSGPELSPKGFHDHIPLRRSPQVHLQSTLTQFLDRPLLCCRDAPALGLEFRQ